MRRAAVLASVMAVSCASAQLPPLTIELPVPPASGERHEPSPRNWRRAEPLSETRVVSSGIALFADGNILRAVVNATGEDGWLARVDNPRVDFSVFENGKWRAIIECQGVSECDISPYMSPGFRIRARYNGRMPVTGEYAP